ncbi:hypothetical protein QBC43DRAFT_284679 [Cladorrhinum sp. PSN259]|nr:hypothetical protein QBC43DRAFT_284679 [Cladorrhinum sp. PSN259]
MCFGRSKSHSKPNRPYPPMARPQQEPVKTQGRVASPPQRQIPPRLASHAKYFNPNIEPSKGVPKPARPAVSHAPLAMNAPYYNPSIRSSRTSSSVPAGAPRPQAAYREPPTPYPVADQMQKMRSPAPALPSTFTTFTPGMAAAATTRTTSKGRTGPRPPPLVMNKTGIKFESPYTLTRNEIQAGLSPLTIKSNWTSGVSSVSSAASVSPI